MRPKTGRYLRSDPIGLGDGPNTYLYGQANPLMCTDPYGLFSATDLPTLPQGFVDFSAGAGDVITFGIGKQIRRLDGIGSVNVCSSNYSNGEWAGVVASAVTGFVGGTKAVARAGSTYDWQNFSHSLVANRTLKKSTNRIAKWLNKSGNRLNGDHINPELHRLIDPVANAVGRTLAERRANPPFPAWRRGLNRIPYAPRAAAYGTSSRALNRAANCEECGCQ